MKKEYDVKERIRGFLPLSMVDWPGKISSVIFLGGCNLLCPTCHNAQLAFSYKNMAKISFEYVENYLKNRKKWIDGVTITGGEPTLTEDIVDFVKEIFFNTGVKIKLDSNGTNPYLLEKLINYVDVFAVDIKGPYLKYNQLVGKNINIRENMEYIIDMAKKQPEKFYFRCTKVPLLIEEDFKDVMAIVPLQCKIFFQDYRDPK